MALKTGKKKKTASKSDYHHGDLRRGLLTAASELLEEVGYEGFTLRKCAARAGVSPSAPAHHFKDAAGLLGSLAVEGFASLSASLRSAYLAANKNSANLCRESAKEYIQFAKKNPALYKVMFGSKLDTNNAEMRQASEHCFKNLMLAVAETFPMKTPDEVRLRALSMWTSVHGLSMLIIENRLSFLLGEQNLAELEKAWIDAQTTVYEK